MATGRGAASGVHGRLGEQGDRREARAQGVARLGGTEPGGTGSGETGPGAEKAAGEPREVTRSRE